MVPEQNPNSLKTICLILLATTILAAAPAMSQEDNTSEARALFSQAMDAYSANDFRGSAQLFRKAYELKPSWKIHYNIGQAEAAAKQYGLALEAFEAYLAEGGDRVEVQRSEEVMSEISRLRLLVGTVELAAPDGTEVHVDGMLRGTAPLHAALQVGVGKKEVILILNGEEILKDEFIFRGGSPTRIAVENSTDAANVNADAGDTTAIEDDDATIETTRPTPWTPLRITGWSLAGTGAAVLIGGVITGSLSLSKKNSLDEDCKNNVCSNPDDKNKIDSAKKLGNVSTALYIAGGALAATGVVLLVLNKKKGQESVALQVSPVVSRSLQGVFLQGEF